MTIRPDQHSTPVFDDCFANEPPQGSAIEVLARAKANRSRHRRTAAAAIGSAAALGLSAVLVVTLHGAGTVNQPAEQPDQPTATVRPVEDRDSATKLRRDIEKCLTDSKIKSCTFDGPIKVTITRESPGTKAQAAADKRSMVKVRVAVKDALQRAAYGQLSEAEFHLGDGRIPEAGERRRAPYVTARFW